jgi:hypothetical protein
VNEKKRLRDGEKGRGVEGVKGRRRNRDGGQKAE